MCGLGVENRRKDIAKGVMTQPLPQINLGQKQYKTLTKGAVRCFKMKNLRIFAFLRLEHTDTPPKK